MFVPPTYRQLKAAKSLGIEVPGDFDRYQVQKLLSEKIDEAKDSTLALMAEAHLQQSAVVTYEGANWIITAPPTTRHLCLRECGGGEKRIMSPTGRSKQAGVYLRVKVVYVPPLGYIHPFSLEADPRLVDAQHFVVVLNRLLEVMPQEACLKTGFGTFWKQDIVAGEIDAYFGPLKTTDEVRQRETDTKAATERKAKAPTRTMHCVSCGEVMKETTSRADRRCSGCREEGIRLGSQRHCVTCGERFTVNTDGATRWRCKTHQDPTP